jgi:hypothetical protein
MGVYLVIEARGAAPHANRTTGLELKERAMRGIVTTMVIAGTAAVVLADSNVADPKKFAWSENVGWLNWRDANGTTQGVEVYAGSHLRGYIWAENAGWINVGTGSAPYANTTGADFGVNLAPGTGAMTGFAWSENLGWINFGPHAGDARWDAAAFRARGYAWSENAGWINLEDGVRVICSIPGDGNGDGVVNASDFTVLAGNYGSAGNPRFRNGDATGDGVVNASDFTVLAGNFGEVCP